ncbi:uncharacterized protein G2W53_009830 [Senna tora]|uniref:Uncharacterized protein n=1 Tax=Senna tora TaxID=362788 RepID=A0A835C8K7_9FABA|nr:uncharacterized protein G2W53_009830 [Senna tora]
MGGALDHVLTYSDDKSRSDLRNLHELRGKRLVAEVSQAHRLALYSRTGVVLMLRWESSRLGRSVDHVLTYSGRQIAVGSQKPSPITRQKTCCAASSNTPLDMGGAWIMILTYSGRQIAVGSQKPSRITRQKTCCASESNTSVRVVFPNRSGLMLRLESSWHGRSVDHVLPYSERQIMVGSQKPSRITRQKTCCASESNTSVRVVFANGSGFDAPIGVVLAWEERGSCLNKFRTKNRSRISETFTNYEAKDLLRKNLHELRGKRLVAQVSQTRRFALYSRTGVVLMLRLESSWHGRSVDHVSTYSERQIAVGSQKPSRITRQKTCCASESNASVRVVFANGSGFDAPIGVVLAWEERGSCLTYSERQIVDRISENLHELRGKRLVAQVSQTQSVRVVFANRSGFDAPIGVVLAWDERGS